MTIRKRLAAIAVTVPLIAGTTLFTAAPAQAYNEPIDVDCGYVALQVEYAWNMHEWHRVFFGSDHPSTRNWARYAYMGAEYYNDRC